MPGLKYCVGLLGQEGSYVLRMEFYVVVLLQLVEGGGLSLSIAVSQSNVLLLHVLFELIVKSNLTHFTCFLIEEALTVIVFVESVLVKHVSQTHLASAA